MPEVCPVYYWLDVFRLDALALAGRLQYREASFFDNPRVPDALRESGATLRMCARGGRAGTCPPDDGGGSVGGSEGHVVTHAFGQPFSSLISSLATVSSARLLRVQHAQWLSLPSAMPSAAHVPSKAEAALLTRNVWCSACAVTRRGAVIGELNRSVVHELENFCRTEARGRLGLAPRQQTCCERAGPCHDCRPRERPTLNASRVRWPHEWMPLWAGLDVLQPRGYGAVDGAAAAGPRRLPAGAPLPRCAHPLCTGTDRTRYP